MTWTTSNPVSVDEATKADDYDALWDNAQALADLRVEKYLGGAYYIGVTDTTYITVPSSIQTWNDASPVSGLSVRFEFQADLVSGTGYARLYNVTGAAAVASSEVTFTTAGRKSSGAITLASALNAYICQVKGSVAGCLPRVWGAKIVIWG